MSVGKNFRSVTKLKVVTDAIDLCNYTMDTCGKENNFPKRSRWMLAAKIVDLSQEIVDHVIKGNEIAVKLTDDYIKRRSHQRDAYCACESLLTFIAIAYQRFGLDGVSVEFWTGNVIGLEQKLINWRSSDMKRFKAFVPKELLGDELDEAVNEELEAAQNDLPF